MVALGGQYDGEESTFEPIPVGEYAMHITISGMEATKDGRGQFLKLEMEIIDGPQAGRKLTDRLNLVNPNVQAVEIAQRTLRAIVFAAGLSTCTDSEQLHMRRMLVRVNIEERRDKPGTMSNRIGGYKPAGGVAAAPAREVAAPATKTATTAAAGGAPPWKRAAG